MLRVLAGPGCGDVAADAYADKHMGPDDIKISVGSIYKSLTESNGIPSENSSALRLALYARTVLIRQARETELSGFVITSNGGRESLDRLSRETGSPGAIVIKMTEAQACTRVRRLVKGAARIAACEEGIKKRWFGRYERGPDDVEVDP